MSYQIQAVDSKVWHLLNDAYTKLSAAVSRVFSWIKTAATASANKASEATQSGATKALDWLGDTVQEVGHSLVWGWHLLKAEVENKVRGIDYWLDDHPKTTVIAIVLIGTVGGNVLP